MNKWTALLLIVIVIIVDKHVIGWISIIKAKIAENTAKLEHEKAESEERRANLDKLAAETKKVTVQMEAQISEYISNMNAEQLKAYHNFIASKYENCHMQLLSANQLQNSIAQLLPRYWFKY